RVQIVGGRVDQVARERRGLREALPSPHAVLGLARATRVGLDEAELADDPLGFLALVAVEVVRAENRALHDGLRALARGEPIAEELRGPRARAEIAGPAHRRRRRPAQNLGAHLGPRA